MVALITHMQGPYFRIMHSHLAAGDDKDFIENILPWRLAIVILSLLHFLDFRGHVAEEHRRSNHHRVRVTCHEQPPSLV